MPLTKAQCTNCGGTLEIDSSKEAAVCPFCNTPYIVEKAINLYKTENHVTNNITYYGDGIVPELKIKNAWILIRDNHIDAAVKLLDEYVNVNPNDYRVWLGYYFCRNKEDRASLASATEKSTSEIKGLLSSQLALIDEIDPKPNHINQLRQRKEYLQKYVDKEPIAPFGLLILGLLLAVDMLFNGHSASLFFCVTFIIGAIILFCDRYQKTKAFKKIVVELKDVEINYEELMSKKLTNDKNLSDYVIQSFGE